MIILKLVRKLRTKTYTRNILQSVREEYVKLANDVVDELLNDIQGWKEKPRFTYYVAVSSNLWLVEIKMDARASISQIYRWVDQGTGLSGPRHSAYPIYPVQAKVLHFKVPHYPQTLPTGPVIGPRIVLGHGSSYQGDVFTYKVTHPGITPRHFVKTITDKLKNRAWSGGFKARTDKAVKAGIRRSKQWWSK